jgi:hypothetical protein
MVPKEETKRIRRQAGFLLGQHFDPEEEGDMFLRNVRLSLKHKVLQHKIPYSSDFSTF